MQIISPQLDLFLPLWAQLVSPMLFGTALFIQFIVIGPALAWLIAKHLPRKGRFYQTAIAMPLSTLAILLFNWLVNVILLVMYLHQMAEASAGQGAPFW